MFFTYKVVDKKGNEIEGRIEATNRTGAISALLNKEYTVLSLDEEKSGALEISFFQRVKIQDLVIFSRQIATLFEAEISALRAFNLVAENVTNTYFQGILRDIARKVEEGFSIEKAFNQHKDVFGEFFIAVIGVGERSGTLPRSFLYLADYTERNADIISRLRKALTYPIFIIFTFIVVMVLMLTTVIPQISGILVQSGAELPVLTKAVIALSDFFKDNIVMIIICTVGVAICFIYWARTEDGRKTVDGLLITLPVIGKLLRSFYLVRFTNNFSVMLSSGVPIVVALQTIGRVMGNKVYMELIMEVENKVRQGTTLSAALENQTLISRNVTQIIKIGEETGKLSQMLKVISDFYEKQLQNTIDALLDLIQPIIIVLLGASVGLLIGSVMVPIYSISSGI